MQSLLNILSVFARVITSPFAWLARILGVGGVAGQAQGFRTIFGSLGRRLGDVLPKSNYLNDMRETMEAWREEREYRRQHKDTPLIYTPEAADYSQIHITTGNQKQVLHIGATTGSTSAVLALHEATEKPLSLTFRRVNDAQYGAPFMLSIEGDCEAALNGRVLQDEMPVRNRSHLNIDDGDYLIEFFAWQSLPYAPRMEVGWYTHKGPIRHHNEDAIGMAKSSYGQIFVVADGVGGGERGELISEFAVQYLLATFDRNIRYNYDWIKLLEQAYKNINQEVRRFGMQSQALTGTTLTCVVMKGWDAFVAHVGDSRLYHVTGGVAHLVTTDHVRVVKRSANSIDSELPTQLERNVLAKAIGKEDQIEPQLIVRRLQPGDSLLLMTDGAAAKLTNDELAQIAATYRPVTLPQHIASVANERFNADNLTVLHVQIKTHNKRTVWRPEAADRVYVGYNRGWSLRLNAPLAMYTNYRVIRQRRSLVVWLIVLLIAAGLTFAAYQARQQTLFALSTTTIAETITPSFTPSPSATRRPPTQTPVVTLTATLTQVPPTSTLQPLPTSTLAQISRP